MGLGKRGASAPLIPGQESLARNQEWRLFLNGVNAGDAQTLNGVVRNMPGGGLTMLRVLTGVAPGLQFIDTRRAMLVQSNGAQSSNLAFRPWLNAPNPVLFSAIFPPVTGPVSTVDYGGAWSIEAWVRKLLAGSATHAKTVFGFGDNNALAPSATVPRCGLIGDGVLGFRFGSVGCPDGAAAGETAANAIDANFLQPAELVNPGVNWFHVKVTMFPATAVTPGRWAAYLNGRLQKVFDQVANIPRGSAAVNRDYREVEATIYSFLDAGPIPGVYYHDVRVTIDDNAQVPGS